LPTHIKTDIIRRKPVRWLGDSLNRVREFPHDPRQALGAELRHVQEGEMPAD
jgi:Phage-related protein